MHDAHDGCGGAADQSHDFGAEGEGLFYVVVGEGGEFGEVVAGAEDGPWGTAEDEDVGEGGAVGEEARAGDEPGVLVDCGVGWAFGGGSGGEGGRGGFEFGEEGWGEGREEAELAVDGGGVVGVELGSY